MNRRFRLLAALSVTIALTTFMLYSALAGGDVQEPVLQVAQLDDRAALAQSRTVQLEGVAAGPVKEDTAGETRELRFFMTDRKGRSRTSITYTGSVPDAFKPGRHVLVKGRLADGGTFVAERNSLVTKCPSKFQGSA